MIAPNRFTFNNMSSLDFDVFTQFAFDENSGETNTGLDRDAVVSETYNNALKLGINYKWNQNLEFQITLIKNNFGDFSVEESRRLLSWLTGKQTPGFLIIYEDSSNIITYEVLGAFTQISQYKLGNGRIVGYVCTFSALTPYALSPIQKYPTDTADSLKVTTPQTFTIKCDTDEPESLIYPKITITEANSVVVEADAALGTTFIAGKVAPDGYVVGTVYKYNNTFYWVGTDGKMIGQSTNASGLSTTSVVIENLTLGTRTVIGKNVIDETVILDGANRVVSSSRPTGRIFGDSFNWQWLPLAIGDNQIKVTGNCNIKFEYRSPVKVGDWGGNGSCN